MTKILVIEDNKDLALGLKNTLEIEGYNVERAKDGKEGLVKLSTNFPELIILDLMMPNMDGYTFLKKLENFAPKPMVLILSARNTEVDKVTGLKLGADDFLTKPFGLMELIARVEALIRRKNSITAATSFANDTNLKIEDIEINQLSRQVFKAGVEIELAPKEYDLFLKLLNNRGQVISRIELMQQVWGHTSVIESRTVDTHIAEIRRKLGSNNTPSSIIKTVRKIGYRIDE